MTAPAKITEFLQRKGVEFEVIPHAETFSAAEEAHSIGTAEDEVAKVVVVHAKGRSALVTLPANSRVDMHALREELGDTHARLATEDEMRQEMPDYELGSIPPLAELVGAPLFVDRHVMEHPQVVFAAGTHTDSIRMPTSALGTLGRHTVVDVCRPAREEDARGW